MAGKSAKRTRARVVGDSKCGSGRANCYAFRMPPSYLDELINECGIDLMSLANNHALDFGARCRANLEQRLTARNISWSGRPGTYSVKRTSDGLDVAFVAFHYSGTSNSLHDLAGVASLVRMASAGADITVVSMHCGAEGEAKVRVPNAAEIYFGENRGNCRAFTHAAIDAGADLVFGAGACGGSERVFRRFRVDFNKFFVFSSRPRAARASRPRVIQRPVDCALARV